MKRRLLVAFLVLAPGGPLAAAAPPCRIVANEIIGTFAPERMIAAAGDVTAATIERVGAAVDAFAARALPAIDRTLACAESRRQSFMARYVGGGLDEAVRAAYRRYGVPPTDQDGDDNYRAAARHTAALRRTATVALEGFYGRPRLLHRARALIAALPAAWAEYARAAKATPGPLPAWVRNGVVEDARERSGALVGYLRYLDAALEHWFEAEDWLADEAWPRLVTLQGRKGWHEEQVRRLGDETSRLERAWEALAARGRDQRALNPHYARLDMRVRREHECLDGLAAATDRLAHRIEVAALLPFIEPFDASDPAPTVPAPPPAGRAAPVACTASLDAETARLWAAGNPGAAVTLPDQPAAGARPTSPPGSGR